MWANGHLSSGHQASALFRRQGRSHGSRTTAVSNEPPGGRALAAARVPLAAYPPMPSLVVNFADRAGHRRTVEHHFQRVAFLDGQIGTCEQRNAAKRFVGYRGRPTTAIGQTQFDFRTIMVGKQPRPLSTIFFRFRDNKVALISGRHVEFWCGTHLFGKLRFFCQS